MSDPISPHRAAPKAPALPRQIVSDGLRRRLPFLVGAATLGVLAIAYFDAGEEPIRPIEQSIAMPVPGEGAQ